MHKRDITPAVAARLVASQFPQWAGLPVRPVASRATTGTWRRSRRSIVGCRSPLAQEKQGGAGADAAGRRSAREVIDLVLADHDRST